MGKFVFSLEDAVKQKKAIFDKMKKLRIDYIDVEKILSDGMVRVQKYVDPVIKYFKGTNIDALFVPPLIFKGNAPTSMQFRLKDD